MNKQPIIQRSAIAFIAATALMAMQGPASAAECKGLEKSKCESNGSCTWVDSYQRKDGAKVDGYCRNKGGKKSSSKSETSSGKSEKSSSKSEN
jgi:hypothetical protein